MLYYQPIKQLERWIISGLVWRHVEHIDFDPLLVAHINTTDGVTRDKPSTREGLEGLLGDSRDVSTTVSYLPLEHQHAG